MFKLRNVMVALVAFTVFMVIPAFAQKSEKSKKEGCRNGDVVGSYTHATVFPDIWGDGSGVSHTYILQLNLHSDGTVYQEASGLPDVMLSQGSGTPLVGSWICRNDGKLVVTAINSAYVPTPDAPAHGFINVPVDLLLQFHFRTTYLFSVTDENTLTRIQARSRRYTPAQDPTDPNGGTLSPLNTNVVVWKRLVASDADLLAP